MLAEAGPSILQQLACANLHPAQIERVFISHAHGDHILGFPMLALNRLPNPTPLHIYTTARSAETLRALWELSYHGFGIEQVRLHWCDLREDVPEEVPLAEGVTLRTAPVPGPPEIPTLAARWDFAGGPSVTFVTDTVFNDAAVELARGSDLLIHEASFSAVLQPDVDPALASHSTARQAGEVARRAGCRQVALVHLGPLTGERPDVLAEEARAGTCLEVIVPEDGERVTLP